MKFKYLLLLLITVILLNQSEINAQSPQGKDFGFGIILGDPTGGTLKWWTQRDNAFVFDIGSSYFGSPRIGVDYLWHFNAFNSDVAYLFAGPGGVIGFGETRGGFWYKHRGDWFFVRERSEVGIAARGVFGVNVIPRNTPIETFFELGVLLGLAPAFGTAIDAAIGIRFYP
jgi:hypothetical protein